MEIIMKKILLAAALAAMTMPSLSAQGVKSDIDPAGVVSYALPQTVLVFDVQAEKETFHAGPYAKYSKKYLGVDARFADETSYKVARVTVTPFIEADPEARYTVTLSKGMSSTLFLQMTTQGLISVSDGSFGDESVWRFPTKQGADFASRGINSNLTSESATLYQKSSSSKVLVQQNMVVEKTDEKKAQEAADMIFKLRNTRVQIVTGDTDANYSGEAMRAALDELTRLEQEYMSLFIGYSDYEMQEKRFDYVPVNDGKGMGVAFRLSDTDGLLPADNMSGKPYFLQIAPETILATADAKNAARKGTGLMYRVPAICSVKLTDGVNSLMQGRFPIFQLGLEKQYTM